ncbi:MAG: hypothetical protein J0M02_01345 [Planctomycetes bacterium]|nr:hypothetical protein [Planctomycetota bacterium]
MTTFTNPATATTYRLVVTGETWRVTKVWNDDGRLHLAHLRGHVAVAPPDAAAVAQLVAGTGGKTDRAADPASTFAAVVLLDLERTADVVVAIAREAEEVYLAGCRGFRPRSPALRRQRDAALLSAKDECRCMAKAWQASGLVPRQVLPAWLTAALTDLSLDAAQDQPT